MIVFANDKDINVVAVAVIVVVNDYQQCSCVSPIIIDNDESCHRCLLLLLNFFCRSSSRCPLPVNPLVYPFDSPPLSSAME